MEEERKIKGFGLIGIIIAIAIIAVLAGGGLYHRELKQQQSLQQIGVETQKRVEDLKTKIEGQQKGLQGELDKGVASEKPSTIDTSTWKTYRNEKYGFEVRYPESWEIEVSNQREVKGIFVSFERKSIEVIALGVFEGTISADIVNKISPRPELKKIAVNGIQMFGLTHSGHQTPYDLYFERNGRVYYFTESFAGREGDREIIEAIVTTFKFIK
ncbi:MAG: Uncharacterized protein G01um101433_244 [Parcubacteria group bacterium Gr01-1014_33]|nr:MAG: Uncharacterized protein G01um101433_244 [Parcubacteria group bacterium Gr01-1014_33]